jgi:hypothetical protein
MDTLENQQPARLVKTDGRLYVTVPADLAEGLRTYLRFHTINATAPDPAEGGYVTLRIDDKVDEDVVQPLIDDWNRDVYGAPAGSGSGAADTETA